MGLSKKGIDSPSCWTGSCFAFPARSPLDSATGTLLADCVDAKSEQMSSSSSSDGVRSFLDGERNEKLDAVSAGTWPL